MTYLGRVLTSRKPAPERHCTLFKAVIRFAGKANDETEKVGLRFARIFDE